MIVLYSGEREEKGAHRVQQSRDDRERKPSTNHHDGARHANYEPENQKSFLRDFECLYFC